MNVYGSLAGPEVGSFGTGNVHRVREREVGMKGDAAGFINAASGFVPVDRARLILADMGVPPLPHSVVLRSDSTVLIEAAPKMTALQIAEFMRRAKQED